MKTEREHLLHQAERSIGAAEALLNNGDADFAVSRAYYAMFYAATAMLLGLDLKFSKHTGVHGAFGERFGRTGHVEPKYHRWLIDAFGKRSQGDYGFNVTLTEDDAGRSLPKPRTSWPWHMLIWRLPKGAPGRARKMQDDNLPRSLLGIPPIWSPGCDHGRRRPRGGVPSCRRCLRRGDWFWLLGRGHMAYGSTCERFLAGRAFHLVATCEPLRVGTGGHRHRPYACRTPHCRRTLVRRHAHTHWIDTPGRLWLRPHRRSASHSIGRAALVWRVFPSRLWRSK